MRQQSRISGRAHRQIQPICIQFREVILPGLCVQLVDDTGVDGNLQAGTLRSIDLCNEEFGFGVEAGFRGAEVVGQMGLEHGLSTFCPWLGWSHRLPPPNGKNICGQGGNVCPARTRLPKG